MPVMKAVMTKVAVEVEVRKTVVVVVYTSSAASLAENNLSCNRDQSSQSSQFCRVMVTVKR